MMQRVEKIAFRTLGPSDAIPNDFVVPYYLMTASDGLRSRVWTTACTRLTTSVSKEVVMAKVIEFYIPNSFGKPMKWVP